MTSPDGSSDAEHAPAGIVTRTAADVIDLLMVLGIVLVLYFGVAGLRLVTGPRRFTWPTLPGGLVGGLYCLVLVLYLAATWSSTGRSIGKQVLGLRVGRRDGSPRGPSRALLRAVLCAIFPVGLLWCLVDRRSASVQDLLLRTRVVYDWRARSPRAELPTLAADHRRGASEGTSRSAPPSDR